MELIKDLLQVSPPIALALALNLVGMAMKKSPLANWLIPWTLIALGAIVFPWISDYSKINFQCRNPMVLNSIYGATIGGLAVGLHEGITTFLDARKKTGGTDFVKRSDIVEGQ